jgi:type IV secretory pathway VirB10-like protein
MAIEQNHNQIPSAPMSAEEQHRLQNMGIIAISIIVIFAILYWWTTSGGEPRQAAQAPSVSTDIRTQVASMLANSPTPPTPDEIKSVAAQLQASSNTITDTEKQAVANALRQAK